MKFLNHLSVVTVTLVSVVFAQAPQVTLNDNQVVTGVREGSVDTFKGIPFANPPLGDLRWKKPEKYTGTYSNLKAEDFRGSCLQWNPANLWTILDNAVNLGQIIPSNIRGPLYDMVDGSVSMSEDCLHVNVFRPQGTKPGDKLPVMAWIYGGAYLFGSTGTYPGNRFVADSVSMGKPIIFVSMNYRLGPYGFLSSPEIIEEGNTNIGLHDQRAALEWIQDHIADFGGDPEKVTIFGESAGAMSVAHQLVAYGGDNTYNGKSLFRGAILQSGGPLPVSGITSKGATDAYNKFVNRAGCASASSPLECLRRQNVNQLQQAFNDYTLKDIYGVLPMFIGFTPRADGDILPDESFNLFTSGRFAKVPYISGNCEDEGSMFAVTMLNASTTAHVKQWLSYIFPTANSQSLDKVLELYPASLIQGAPFRTGLLNALTPQWKRIGAILTDVLFQSPRRTMLDSSSGVKTWSYLSTALYGLVPFLGTFHASDVLFQFFLGLSPSRAFRRYWISFAADQDPNTSSGLTNWKQYTTGGKEMLEIKLIGNNMRQDDFRNDGISNFMADNSIRA